MAQDQLVVVSDIWMPYNGKPDSKMEGYAVEILRAVFKRQGVEVKYIERPWKRAVEDVRSGKADLVIGALHSEAPDFIFPEQSLGRTAMCFYTNWRSWKFTGPESLKEVRTGLVQGYGYRDWLTKDAKNNPGRYQVLHGEDALPRLIQILEQDRVQAIPGNQAVVNYYIKTLGLEDAIFMAGCEKDVEPRELFFALSPAHSERSRKLAAIIDKGIATMRMSGQLNHLLIKYGLKDWVKIK